MTFFRSRWVDAPGQVTELDSQVLPAGFRAAGVAAGIKPEGLDVGVVASSEPDTVSAARFTTNARVGAPVMVSREAELGRLRAVVANSGCSNVGSCPASAMISRCTSNPAAMPTYFVSSRPLIIAMRRSIAPR